MTQQLRAKIMAPAFDALLTRLITREIPAIDYGDPSGNDPSLSGIRLRYVNTPGGWQLCIKRLSSFGQEKSGDYFPTEQLIEFKLALYGEMLDYEKPIDHPMIRRLLQQRERVNLAFFPSAG
jgi:hypothetical protein